MLKSLAWGPTLVAMTGGKPLLYTWKERVRGNQSLTVHSLLFDNACQIHKTLSTCGNMILWCIWSTASWALASLV